MNSEIESSVTSEQASAKKAARKSKSKLQRLADRPTSSELTLWLPGMDSNHELDRFLKSHNLLILKSR